MLEARGLTKYYSAITGVRDVNFQVPRGTVLGLLGPNGSGKSTTVGMLTGLLEPSTAPTSARTFLPTNAGSVTCRKRRSSTPG